MAMSYTNTKYTISISLLSTMFNGTMTVTLREDPIENAEMVIYGS
jgi:hypothetical protein